MNKAMMSVLAVAIALLGTSAVGAAQTVKLKKNQVYRVSSGSRPLCGFLTAQNRWRPVQKVGSKYRVARNSSSGAATACAALLKPARGRSLSQLPDASEIVSESNLGGASVMNVSGTPPTFPELVESGGENIFWRSGVVDAIATGTPTEGECGEFFSSVTDGESGGYGACYLAEGVSYSISEIASSGTTLCYMRKFPSAAVEDSQLVEVLSGNLPGGSVANIFNQPTGSRARVVKIQPTGDEEGGGPMYIRVYSAEQNATQGNQYRVDFWACDNGEDEEPQEAQQFRVNAGGELIATSINSHEGQRFTSTVRGFLKTGSDGLEFDPTRGRSAVFGGGNDNEGTERNFKSRVEINGENEIRHWVRDAMGDAQLRKGYSASRFGGDGLVNLRFYEGAFKELQTGERSYEFGGATEYRDTYYAAAPSSSFTADVSEIDLTSEEFYDEGITVPQISETQFSCSQRPDISITLDMSRESMQAVAGECESGRVDGQIQFCQSETLRTAAERYQSVCSE